jgi:Xaa-Pro aminopeptidase
MAELTEKRRRLAGFLAENKLDGLLFSTRANFAWATGGRVNRILNASPVGVAAVLMTPEKTVCLTNTIEGPRFRDEELVDVPTGEKIDVVEFAWYDAGSRRKVGAELLGGRRIAADVDAFDLGLPAIPKGFDLLKWSLTPEEIERYRVGGKLASEAMEAACRDLKPEMTEHDAAGILTFHIHRLGLNPVVTLVAADDRIRRFRHPIPTGHKISKYVMLVNCSEYGGLISNLTRFVHFGKMDADLVARHQAVCEVDAAINQATRPGRTLGELFSDLEVAYDGAGYGGEWKLHHQGGSTGYAGRDVFATPGDGTKVLSNQAFAWNPSITGTKSEDTVLIVEGKPLEVLTPASASWPKVATRRGMERPGMLVV